MNIKNKAKKDYIQGMKQVQIAGKYNININTVKSWVSREKWKDLKKEYEKVNATNVGKKVKKVATKTKKVATENTKENVEKTRKNRKLLGNQNAKKSGLYQDIMYSTLDEDELELLESLNDDEEQHLKEQLKIVTIREYRYLKHIRMLKEQEKELLTIEEDKEVKKIDRDASTVENTFSETHKGGSSKSVHILIMINKYEGELTKVQKLKKQIIDSIAKIKESKENIKISRERLELEKYKIYGNENEEGKNESIQSFLQSTQNIFSQELQELYSDFKEDDYDLGGNEDGKE